MGLKNLYKLIYDIHIIQFIGSQTRNFFCSLAFGEPNRETIISSFTILISSANLDILEDKYYQVGDIVRGDKKVLNINPRF